MTILVLKIMNNKTCFKALNRAIRVGLDLVDPLAHDQNNRERVRSKIPNVSTLKSSNLFSHGKLSLKISNNISICGRLRKRDCKA
jgi:hypothetical protein